jgi:hypothetical protein
MTGRGFRLSKCTGGGEMTTLVEGRVTSDASEFRLLIALKAALESGRNCLTARRIASAPRDG